MKRQFLNSKMRVKHLLTLFICYKDVQFDRHIKLCVQFSFCLLFVNYLKLYIYIFMSVNVLQK